MIKRKSSRVLGVLLLALALVGTLTGCVPAIVRAAAYDDLPLAKEEMAKPDFKLEQGYAQNRTALYVAAAYGSKQVLEALLAKGAKVNAADTEGQTPLHAALCKTWFYKGDKQYHEMNASEREQVAKAHLAVANVLIARGADVKAAALGGLTPLHCVARNFPEAGLDVAKQLVAKGADVNATLTLGETPVFPAVRSVELLKFLVSKGANPKATANFGFTPLHEAASAGALESIEFLLKRGVDINARTEERRGLNTPIFYADNEATFVLLMKNKADIKLKNKSGFAAYDSIIQRRAEWPVKVFQAIANGNESDVRKYIQFGGDPNRVGLFKFENGDQEGVLWTPAHLAAFMTNLPVMKALTEAGADVTVPLPRGQIAFSFGEQIRSAQMGVSGLGSLFGAGELTYWSPLLVAKVKDSPELVSYLTSKGATDKASVGRLQELTGRVKAWREQYGFEQR